MAGPAIGACRCAAVCLPATLIKHLVTHGNKCFFLSGATRHTLRTTALLYHPQQKYIRAHKKNVAFLFSLRFFSSLGFCSICLLRF
jgi:hypothetical protein